MKLRHFAVFGGIFTVIIGLLLFLFIVTADDEESSTSHYDFSGLLGMQACKGKSADELLIEATRKTVKMDPGDYLCWLDESMTMMAKRIDDLISLPVANKG